MLLTVLAVPSVTTASAGNTNVTTPTGDVIITTTTGDINASKSTGDGNTTAGVAAPTTTVAAANELTTAGGWSVALVNYIIIIRKLILHLNPWKPELRGTANTKGHSKHEIGIQCKSCEHVDGYTRELRRMSRFKR